MFLYLFCSFIVGALPDSEAAVKMDQCASIVKSCTQQGRACKRQDALTELIDLLEAPVDETK